MKTCSSSSSRQGFTLVELLVVIAIIAVLATIGVTGGGAALEKARRTTAQATATSIANAVEQFYVEYAALPQSSSTASAGAGDIEVKTDSDGVPILRALTGEDTAQNPRGIRFLSVKQAKGTGATYKDGAQYSGSSIVGIRDPWGQPFYLVIDANYDGKIDFPAGSPLPSVPATINGRRVVVYSNGTDGGAASTKTFVKTW